MTDSVNIDLRIDGRRNALLLSGAGIGGIELTSYAAVEALVDHLFRVAPILWPDDSAAHDARIAGGGIEAPPARKALPAPAKSKVPPDVGRREAVLEKTKAGLTPKTDPGPAFPMHSFASRVLGRT